MKDDLSKVVPFYPIYARAPNKLVRYDERPFSIPSTGQTGVERVAIFLDKNKKEQEMSAQVMWD